MSSDWVLFGNDVNRKNDNLISDKYVTLYNLLENLPDKDKQFLEDFIEFLKHRFMKEEESSYADASQSLSIAAEEQATYTDESYIPLLGDSAAGKPILINEVLEGYLPIGKKISNQKAFAVRAKGDSMIGAGIENGDIIVIKHQPIVEYGEVALFRINDESTIKYFSPQGSDILLLPANPKYKPIPVGPKDTFAIIGKVVQVIKKEEAEKKLRHFHEE